VIFQKQKQSIELALLSACCIFKKERTKKIKNQFKNKTKK
jgi:hypothetical protein